MKRQRRVRWLLSGSLAAAVALAPGPAAAQASPEQDQERPTLRIGPFELKPRLQIGNIGIDYNVFNDNQNPEQDFTFTVAPDVEVSVHPGRLRAAYSSGSELVYFQKFTSERSVNRNFGARLDLDLTFLQPFAAMTSAHTSSRANSEIDVRARHHPRTYTAGTRLKLASRTSATFTARQATESYDDDSEFRGVQLSRLLDNKTMSYEGSLNFDVTPFTTISVGATTEQMRFDHSPVRNANSLRITPTVTFSPLGQITGTGSVGYRRVDGLDPSLSDYSGVVASGAIGLLMGGRYKLETLFTRDVRYSYEEDLPYYVLTGGRGTLAVQTFSALDVRVTAGRESMDYRALADEPSPGKDRATVYGGGLGYRIANRVRVVLEMEFWHRTSEREDEREYRNKRIVMSVNWGALNR
jgi:hypothetical protein